jgi:hypothetical protein
MKQKIISIVIALLVTFSLYGQQHEYSFEKHSKKTHQEHKKKLDAFHFQDQHKLLRTPELKSAGDEKSSLDIRDYYLWDATSSQWLIYDKETYTFDNNGNLEQYMYYLWDDDYGDVLLDYRVDFTYDANGNRSLVTEYYWDVNSGLWITNWKTEYTYDAHENLTLRIDYAWDDEWIQLQKEEFTYDENDHKLTYLYFEWDQSTSLWIENYYETILYDEDGNRIELLQHEMDESESFFLAVYKIEYSYDTDNLLIESIEYNWDVSIPDWVEAWKYEFTNNSNGSVNTKDEFQWDDLAEAWVETWRSEYVFDTNGNPIMEQYSLLDDNSGLLVYYTQYEYTYDLLFGLPDLLLPPLEWFVPDQSFLIVNKPLESVSKDYDSNLGEWVNYSKVIYSYDVGDNTSLEEDQDKAPIGIFPNPVSDFLSFSFSDDQGALSFELYDMTGRTILTREVSMGEKVNMEQVGTGVYLYQITVKGKTARGKLIKK